MKRKRLALAVVFATGAAAYVIGPGAGTAAAQARQACPRSQLMRLHRSHARRLVRDADDQGRFGRTGLDGRLRPLRQGGEHGRGERHRRGGARPAPDQPAAGAARQHASGDRVGDRAGRERERRRAGAAGCLRGCRERGRSGSARSLAAWRYRRPHGVRRRLVADLGKRTRHQWETAIVSSPAAKTARPSRSPTTSQRTSPSTS